ncbi:aspartate aminotransferase family protein [Mesorhizobium sp. AD1-1]|uniref:aspartate aminotransferase family protein n=1 Tax=Mesorhizobium sp. AD1-1 TaxID=2876621 RepID=UPI001CCF9943|nr:aspartate aminotransferase family protein [Mesorhizobium sp. AD1-1]MBZ9719187.1 aspartate aminotransferase family protein [Mesorhizobium sp. AD1-1]
MSLDPKHPGVDNLLFYGRDFSETIVERASGTYIYDQNGREIIDFSSGQMCATLGHNHPVIVEAIEKSCKSVIHLDSTKLSRAVLDLAQELCQLLPAQLQKAMFLNTGAESNEAAIRLAKLHTGKFEIVGFTGSWHGMTAGAQSNTYASARRGYGPSATGNFSLPAPNCYRCPIRHCSEKCDKTCLEVGFEQFDSWSVGAAAAVIIEPVQSAGGMIVPPPGYLARLKELCEARGMILIFDEAQTGLGRVGSNFAFETEGVVPDVLTLSKTLGGGVPLAATVTGEQIADDARNKGFNFYTSHVSDPLPAEVGLAIVRLIVEESLAQKALEMGQYLTERLRELQQRFEVIGDIRGRGLLVGVELVEDRYTKRPAIDLIQRASKRCLELGLNINKAGGGNAIWRLAPPLNIEKRDIDRSVAIIEDSLIQCGAS